MNKLLKILIFIVTTSFISSHLYASEVVRLENKIFDNSIYKPSKNEILEWIKNEGNEQYWYGVYQGNEKIGWAVKKSKTYQSDIFNQPIFEENFELNLTRKESGNDGKFFVSNIKISIKEIYEANATFKLLKHHTNIQFDDTETSIFSEVSGVNYKVKYKNNNEKNSSEILLENLDYSLYDFLAIYTWIANNTKKINDVVSYITFDFKELKYFLSEHTIQEVTKKKS